MAKKLWGGRFKSGLDPAAKAYSYSLHSDLRLAPYDIAVNLAHAMALEVAGFISADEGQAIAQALGNLKQRFEAEDATLLADDEDIHSCIERLLTEALGDAGKKIHTGKSRNDQVITDTRLYVKDVATEVCTALQGVMKALYDLAEREKNTLFPGFTHLQTAQPVLLGHHLLAYFAKFERDFDRFTAVYQRSDECVLGSGALAGNNYGLDRALVARKLGFSRLSQNSMDAVSDRDFILEFLSSASICMTHLSRFCEELILWSSPLLAFVTIGDAFTTGSSIMPQKKNPDIAELIRGRAGRVLGDFVALSETLKGLPLTYNRDLQEDKLHLFDAADVLLPSLICFERMIATLDFHSDTIGKALENGFILATDFADYLVKKGVPFRDAHEITGQVVLKAEQDDVRLESMDLKDLKAFSDKIEDDVQAVFDMLGSVRSKDVLGGTAPNQVETQLRRLKEQYQW